MAWQCPKCQIICEGKFCPKCGMQYMTEYGNVGISHIDSSNAYLMQRVEKLKNLCNTLICIIIIITAVFGFAYYSVWENVNDLWENADDLWENADLLWDSSESLWFEHWDDNYYYRY